MQAVDLWGSHRQVSYSRYLTIFYRSIKIHGEPSISPVSQRFFSPCIKRRWHFIPRNLYRKGHRGFSYGLTCMTRLCVNACSKCAACIHTSGWFIASRVRARALPFLIVLSYKLKKERSVRLSWVRPFPGCAPETLKITHTIYRVFCFARYLVFHNGKLRKNNCVNASKSEIN